MKGVRRLSAAILKIAEIESRVPESIGSRTLVTYRVRCISHANLLLYHREQPFLLHHYHVARYLETVSFSKIFSLHLKLPTLVTFLIATPDSVSSRTFNRHGEHNHGGSAQCKRLRVIPLRAFRSRSDNIHRPILLHHHDSPLPVRTYTDLDHDSPARRRLLYVTHSPTARYRG